VVARILESEGFATVIVYTFKEVAEAMRPPRALYVRFPIGLTLGAPRMAAQQRVVVEDALALLGEAQAPGILSVAPYRWQHVDYERLLGERRAAADERALGS
jgi:D-proline reductase (dithiol) PrdB